MSISLKQFDESIVLPEEDAKLFNFMIGDNTSGIVEGAQVTFLGANKLKVSAGWGICQGRMFVIEEETISAKVSANGELQGRIIINIDTSAENPISFVTQAEKTLPKLIEEDLNHSGTNHQLVLATYTVNEVLVSNLKDSRKIIRNNMEVHSVTQAGTDLNDYKKQGVYYFDTNNTPTNIPAGVNGWLIVLPSSERANSTKQIWLRHGSPNANDYETYVRIQSGSTWGDWSRLATTKDIETVKITANNAMPKSGGVFTGSIAVPTNVDGWTYNLKNMDVRSKSNTDPHIAVHGISFWLK